jgi:hypothetical protein
MSSLSAVRNTIGMWASFLRERAIRSSVQPSISGISTSVSTRSGSCLSAADIASRPLSAVLTCRPRARSAAPSSLRTLGESSTSSTLSGLAGVVSTAAGTGSTSTEFTHMPRIFSCSPVKAPSLTRVPFPASAPGSLAAPLRYKMARFGRLNLMRTACSARGCEPPATSRIHAADCPCTRPKSRRRIRSERRTWRPWLVSASRPFPPHILRILPLRANDRLREAGEFG